MDEAYTLQKQQDSALPLDPSTGLPTPPFRTGPLAKVLAMEDAKACGYGVFTKDDSGEVWKAVPNWCASGSELTLTWSFPYYPEASHYEHGPYQIGVSLSDSVVRVARRARTATPASDENDWLDPVRGVPRPPLRSGDGAETLARRDALISGYGVFRTLVHGEMKYWRAVPLFSGNAICDWTYPPYPLAATMADIGQLHLFHPEEG